MVVVVTWQIEGLLTSPSYARIQQSTSVFVWKEGFILEYKLGGITSSTVCQVATSPLNVIHYVLK